MELTKSEMKFLTVMLKGKINDAQRALEQGERNFKSGKFPAYTEEVFEKHVTKNTKVINDCECILTKLNN